MKQKRRKQVTVADLEYGGPKLLLCLECGGEFSADKGDYFMLRESEVLRHCKKPLRLVTKHTQYIDG